MYFLKPDISLVTKSGHFHLLITTKGALSTRPAIGLLESEPVPIDNVLSFREQIVHSCGTSEKSVCGTCGGMIQDAYAVATAPVVSFLVGPDRPTVTDMWFRQLACLTSRDVPGAGKACTTRRVKPA